MIYQNKLIYKPVGDLGPKISFVFTYPDSRVSLDPQRMPTDLLDEKAHDYDY
jgi:hypothetical protein